MLRCMLLLSVAALAATLTGCALMDALLVPHGDGTDSAMVTAARTAQGLAPGATWTEIALAASIAAQNAYLGFKAYRKRR